MNQSFSLIFEIDELLLLLNFLTTKQIYLQCRLMHDERRNQLLTNKEKFIVGSYMTLYQKQLKLHF